MVMIFRKVWKQNISSQPSDIVYINTQVVKLQKKEVWNLFPENIALIRND